MGGGEGVNRARDLELVMQKPDKGTANRPTIARGGRGQGRVQGRGWMGLHCISRINAYECRGVLCGRRVLLPTST